ncbi:acyl transferase domain-containing protein [Limnobacter thiooxidans]|uniref:Carrier domain-containing protein n=1 Tax=Limnobacter thiooxidans TaxID=131080 RepID=A0AA86JLZ8_9BURK|nr:acyl transferase domain-containing protein [Limnobacter thiooxidans]BET27127.1 hypothetical protein RGQ30_26280 [Limnobacter thiooxidans]
MKPSEKHDTTSLDQDNTIAIVAMACNIPQASNTDELWNLLMQKHSTITDLNNEQILRTGISASALSNPSYVKKAGILDDIDKFDSQYFDISAKEADVLDVQQRKMLEAAVHLLNQANIDPGRCAKRIGIFAGSGFSSYLFGILERTDLVDALGEMIIRHGNDKDFLCPRISYKLNLKGPSVNVQTSCSTGLVAVHTACQSLLLHECEMAIAGAVYIRVPQDTGYLHQADSVLSSDGICRPFDSNSDGTIFTNGLGLVLLKRLEDAIQDGDEIVAVIRASAINNDGSQKVGFTAPSVTGQVNVLREAIQIAGIDAADMQYIEAHGTGTALGDPIEMEAIKQAYGENGQPCGLGSLKSNFGHFNIAAGVIGLIKAALILKHKTIPATLHVDKVNPTLGLEQSRFFVTQHSTPLNTSAPQLVAVSAFGMGGTNSHVILQNFETKAPPTSKQSDEFNIFTLSAKSENALNALLIKHIDYFANKPEASFADAAHTAFYCRPHFPNRISFVARRHDEALALLQAGRFNRHLEKEPEKLAFLFSGQGTQHIHMGSQLASKSAQFNQNLEQVLDVFLTEQSVDLRSCLWHEEKAAEIANTETTQPLLFAVEYALAKTLIESGIMPRYVLGHSLGELVAASISGIFDLSTAAAVVVKRAQCMARCEPGSMIAVEDIDCLQALIQARSISVAAHNSPRQFVVSGTHEAIEAAIEILDFKAVGYQRLKTSHAFHSQMMRPAAAEFFEFLKAQKLNEARIPLVSNITGQVLAEYEYKNPIYWSDHLLRTVQFAKSVQSLHELGVSHFVEIGHGYAMGNLIQANKPRNSQGSTSKVVQALGSTDEEYACFLNTIAAAWALSGQLVLAPYVQGHNKVSLPVYPFDKTRHWIEPVIGFRKQLAPVATMQANPPANEAAIATCAESATIKPEAITPGNADDNPVEAIVADIYSTYLGEGTVDREQSFFDLGGNSLIAIQMINKLRETFKLDIPLRGFYENSSVSAVSFQIAQKLLEDEANV